MTSNHAIRVHNLGKRFRISRLQNNHQTLREALMRRSAALFGRVARPRHGHDESDSDRIVWALSDLSCDIPWGEVVGIIGHNGAGKSTLLKILASITEPTRGRVELYGRVGSLLEVGMGFHPELTGRENVFFNGAILGMRQAEIRRKFDEIVAFAEVAKFVDTPVKHYSSGMYMRLAFAVAAHLEPEILLVDEVLAVGDLAFQKKCLNKMGEVARGGRTVVFVSHNLTAVRELCSRAILLDQGHSVMDGSSEQVIAHYLSQSADEESSTVVLPAPLPGTLGGGISLAFSSESGQPQAQFRMGERWHMTLCFVIYQPARHVTASVQLTSLESAPLITYVSKPQDLQQGQCQVVFSVDVPLSACHIQFAVALSSFGFPFYRAVDVGHVVIAPVAVNGQSVRPAGRDLLLSFQRSEITSLPARGPE